MKWSKLKNTVEARFAHSVAGKVHIFSTSYARNGNNCQCGRGWITYNKTQIVEFETILYLERVFRHHEPTNNHGHVVIEPESRMPGLLSERGEWSRYELHQACKALLNLRIDDAINSENPLIQGLAFLDKRFGRERAAAHRMTGLHPLPRRLLEIRQAEDRASSIARQKAAM